MRTFEHDPNSQLDYGVDWADWLNDDDYIYESSWDIEPSGELIVVNGSTTSSDTNTKCFLKVDVAPDTVMGNSYVVTNSIVTGDGLEDDRSFRVRIKNT